MAIEYISYNYVIILYDALVVSVATYGSDLGSIVTRNLTETTQHDIFYKDLIRKELGVSKLCPIPILYNISGKAPLSHQMWRRRLMFFIQGLNSPVDSIIMRGLVELYNLSHYRVVRRQPLSARGGTAIPAKPKFVKFY